ncbi:anaerobic ribonucleoside-triphosphate reductase, partial [Clostridioides difficile]
MSHMRHKMDEATDKYKLNFSLMGTPAEGLSGRFTKIDKKAKKGIRINKVPLQKIQELLGNLNVVIFSPEDLRLVKEGPKERR